MRARLAKCDSQGARLVAFCIGTRPVQTLVRPAIRSHSRWFLLPCPLWHRNRKEVRQGVHLIKQQGASGDNAARLRCGVMMKDAETNSGSQEEPFGEGVRQCRDTKHRGERHWYRITGLRGWERAARGLPAWGLQWTGKKKADQ